MIIIERQLGGRRRYFGAPCNERLGTRRLEETWCDRSDGIGADRLRVTRQLLTFSDVETAYVDYEFHPVGQRVAPCLRHLASLA